MPIYGTLGLFASQPQDSAESAAIGHVRGEVMQELVARFEAPGSTARLQASGERTARRAGGVNTSRAADVARLAFTIRSAGGARDARLAGSTGDPGVDSALLRAVARLDSARVSFHTIEARDTLQIRIDLGFDPSAGDYPMLLIALQPLGSITTPAHIVSTDVYPVVAKSVLARRIDDDIVIHVLVDERGRAVADSVRVVQGTQQAYIDAILAVVPEYHWSPALAGDCPKRQWVEMPFRFHFRKEQ